MFILFMIRHVELCNKIVIFFLYDRVTLGHLALGSPEHQENKENLDPGDCRDMLLQLKAQSSMVQPVTQ